MPTIKDVAEKAGVSTATVSRIMNGKGEASEKTVTRVKAVIAELGFKPNSIARSLTNKKSNTIALLVPTISNPFFPELVRAVEDYAHDQGFNIFLCNTDDERDKVESYLTTLKERYVDGVIINSLNVTKDDLDLLTKNNIAFVTIDRTMNSHDFSSIVVDHREGARIAVQHLLEVGCKKIAHIRGPEEEHTALQRMWGYRDCVKKFEWFDYSWIAGADFSVEGGYQAMKELLMRHPDTEGVFAASDAMAIGALKAAYEWGKKVPDDLAIIGFDGIDMTKYTIPSITTIKQPTYELGKLAMDQLMKLMKQPDVEHVKTVLHAELVLRESTMY